MSSPDAPNASPPAFQQWFARLGNSGKLLMIGGVAGIIATLLPLISSSIEVLGMASASQTLMVVDSWILLGGLHRRHHPRVHPLQADRRPTEAIDLGPPGCRRPHGFVRRDLAHPNDAGDQQYGRFRHGNV
jgi:hypothetical protein